MSNGTQHSKAMQDWNTYQSVMAQEKHKINFQVAFVDMLDGNHLAALLLSQIVYWHLPDKSGGLTKLRVKKKGKLWLVKQRKDWWTEIRMNVRQVDRAMKVLKEKGYIEAEIHRFDNLTAQHIRLIPEKFMPDYLLAAGKLIEEEQIKDNITEQKKALRASTRLELQKSVTPGVTTNGNSINIDYITETTLNTKGDAGTSPARTKGSFASSLTSSEKLVSSQPSSQDQSFSHGSVPDNNMRNEQQHYSEDKRLLQAAEMALQEYYKGTSIAINENQIHKLAVIHDAFEQEYLEHFLFRDYPHRKMETLVKAYQGLIEFMELHDRDGLQISLDTYREMAVKYFRFTEDKGHNAGFEWFCNLEILRYRFHEVCADHGWNGFEPQD